MIEVRQNKSSKIELPHRGFTRAATSWGVNQMSTSKPVATHGRAVMATTIAKCGVAFALMLCLPAISFADTTARCGVGILKGQYVFTASGFTRPPGSLPGTPWVPKAIVEVLQFNGDGSVSTPSVIVANPFGDTGNILQPSTGGATGEYTVNDDCTGTVRFFDAAGVTFNIVVDPPKADTIWMIQVNPLQNVFQGSAKRI